MGIDALDPVVVFTEAATRAAELLPGTPEHAEQMEIMRDVIEGVAELDEDQQQQLAMAWREFAMQASKQRGHAR